MTNQFNFFVGQQVKYIGEASKICGTLGVIDGNKSGDRWPVRWNDPVSGHPITWPEHCELEAVKY